MYCLPRKSLLAAAAALTLGWSVPAGAVDLSACDSGDELVGNWLVLYELRDQQYCTFTVEADGSVTNADCHDKNKKPLKESLGGTLSIDAACAVTGELSLSKSNTEKSKSKGKGKLGNFTVEAQLSEDRSTLVGVFHFRKHLTHAIGQRTN